MIARGIASDKIAVVINSAGLRRCVGADAHAAS
jgi:hypothetical protein